MSRQRILRANELRGFAVAQMGLWRPAASWPIGFSQSRIELTANLRRVVVDTKAQATSVGGNVVDAIRDDFTKLSINEVMHVDLARKIHEVEGEAFGGLG
jgi:hypothetical protein